MTTTTLREQILRRMQSNHQYYAHFVTHEAMNKISNDTTDEILKLIEKHGYRKVETMDGYWSD